MKRLHQSGTSANRHLQEGHSIRRAAGSNRWPFGPTKHHRPVDEWQHPATLLHLPRIAHLAARPRSTPSRIPQIRQTTARFPNTAAPPPLAQQWGLRSLLGRRPPHNPVPCETETRRDFWSNVALLATPAAPIGYDLDASRDSALTAGPVHHSEARRLAEFKCDVAGIWGIRRRRRYSRPGGPDVPDKAACEDAGDLGATIGGGHGGGISDGGHGRLRHWKSRGARRAPSWVTYAEKLQPAQQPRTANASTGVVVTRAP